MQFNSIAFIIFFIIVFVLYYSTKKIGIQNSILLLSSCVFYGWWDWHFLSLISISVLSTYITAILAERSHCKLWTIINVSLNLSILCVFKYFNFFADNLITLARTFGIALDYPTIKVLLPVGISFYTFQAISYSVDVFRNEIRAERNLLSFALYICYFPQLVAGPIERASVLLPQINTERHITYPEMVLGMRQALWGLVKKVVVADGCVHYVDKFFVAEFTLSGVLTASLAAILFSVQIYCDFSGYCDIARGVSQMLGIKIMQNFSYPYFSTNVQQFWRKWNVSLMNWFRDYVYIPLGGSRNGEVKTSRNLIIVFLLSGLWHGASWNFVIWGAYWGVVMVTYRYLRKGGLCTTIGLAMSGWVIFRSESLSQTADMLLLTTIPLISIMILMRLVTYVWKCLNTDIKRIAMATLIVMMVAIVIIKIALILHHLIFVYIFAMFAIEWIGRKHIFALQQMPQNRVFRYGLYYLMIFLILINVHGSAQFIYFKF